MLIEQSPARFGILKIWMESKKRILATLLIGNNLVNILCSILTYRVAMNLMPNWAEAISVFGLTLIVLIFAEITPKSLALNSSASAVVVVMRIVWLMDKLLFPLSWPLSKLPGLITGNNSKGDDEPVASEDEIEFHIRRGIDKSVFKKEEHGELLMSVIEFADTMVKEVMIPRTDMVGIDHNTSVSESLKTILKSGHSRVPVYDDTPDKIVGILYAKDLLRNLKNSDTKENLTAKEVMREETFFVPETQKISTLLTDMRRKGLHLAIVVDEFGGTAGIVTLEDIIEELVGEIRDEYDTDETEIKQIDSNRWQLSAKMAIHDFEHETGLTIRETGDYETVGGYVIAIHGRIPKKGKIIQDDNLQFVVVDGDERHITRLEVRKFHEGLSRN
jgi:CBS domain containing-hemolysin-like protein